MKNLMALKKISFFCSKFFLVMKYVIFSTCEVKIPISCQDQTPLLEFLRFLFTSTHPLRVGALIYLNKYFMKNSWDKHLHSQYVYKE